LTALKKPDVTEVCYRIRADRIDWMTDRDEYVVVSVNGKELHVEEPIHVILEYIKNPYAPLKPKKEYERCPQYSDYAEKYGADEGLRRFHELMHYPPPGYYPPFKK
jgi:hypothetical protein